MSHDNLSDLITRIRNAAALENGKVVELPLTSQVEVVAKLLEKLGFVTGVKVFKDSGAPHKSLHLEPTAKISGCRRVSKPGLRIYKGYKELRLIMGGLGVAILSTPKGVMTDRAARREKLGGEVLFEIW